MRCRGLSAARNALKASAPEYTAARAGREMSGYTTQEKSPDTAVDRSQARRLTSAGEEVGYRRLRSVM